MSAGESKSAAVLLDWNIPRKYLPGRTTVQLKAAHLVVMPEGRPSLGLRDIFFGRFEHEPEFQEQMTVGVDMARGPDSTAVQMLRRSQENLQRQTVMMGNYGGSMISRTAQEMEYQRQRMEQQMQLMQEQMNRAPPMAPILGLADIGDMTFRGQPVLRREHMLEWNAGDDSPEEYNRRLSQVRQAVESGLLSESVGASLLGVQPSPDPNIPELMSRPRLPDPEPISAPTPEPVIGPRTNFVPGRRLELDD